MLYINDKAKYIIHLIAQNGAFVYTPGAPWKERDRHWRDEGHPRPDIWSGVTHINNALLPAIVIVLVFSYIVMTGFTLCWQRLLDRINKVRLT